MKPGVDWARTGDLPHASAVACSVASTSGSVASPRTISTSGISGAGLKKCMPTTRAGRCSPAPIAVIEIDDVLEARIVSGDVTFSSCRNSSRFASRSSTMASITSLADAASPGAWITSTRAAAAAASAAVSLPFAASAASASPIRRFASSAAPIRASKSSTR